MCGRREPDPPITTERKIELLAAVSDFQKSILALLRKKSSQRRLTQTMEQFLEKETNTDRERQFVESTPLWKTVEKYLEQLLQHELEKMKKQVASLGKEMKQLLKPKKSPVPRRKTKRKP